jgi:hypothetical protein
MSGPRLSRNVTPSGAAEGLASARRFFCKKMASRGQIAGKGTLVARLGQKTYYVLVSRGVKAASL